MTVNLIAPNPNFFSAQINLCTRLKVTKSGHHLLHNQASQGHGSVPGLTSQTDLHHSKSL